MSIKAFAIPSASAPVEDWQYEPKSLGNDEVEIAIECCGVVRNVILNNAHFSLSFLLT